MHQGNTEKELMEWFDKQEQDRKWRICACLISTNRPMVEILHQLKTVDAGGRNLQLVHPGSTKRH